MPKLGLICVAAFLMSLCSVTTAQDRGWAASIAWSPDGKTIAVGSSTGVWFFNPDFNEKGYVATPEMGGYPPSSMDWNATGDLLAIGGTGFYNRPILIVDFKERRVVAAIEDQEVTSTVRWHPRYDRILAGTDDGETYIWDALTGKELFHFQESFTSQYSVDNYTQSVCWLDHHRIATMGSATTYLVEVNDENTVVQIPSPYVSVAKCNIHGDILMVGVTGRVSDISAGMTWDDIVNSAYLIGNEPVIAEDVGWSPDGGRFVTNSEGCLVYVFHRESRELLARLDGSFAQYHAIPVYVDSIAWHPGGSWFVVIGQFDIRMWDAETYRLVHKFEGFEAGYHETLKSSIGLSEVERKALMEAHDVRCPERRA